MARTRLFGNITQRNISLKRTKGEQIFLCLTHRLDLMYISIQLHYGISNGYSVMAHTRIFEKKKK